jgi:hypothetical protein
MNGQPQDTPPLVALLPGEQSQAMQRYGMLQPHLEQGVPLTHLARHRGIALRTWLGKEMILLSPPPRRPVRTRHLGHGASHLRPPRGARRRGICRWQV